jgi:hypothetical protein
MNPIVEYEMSDDDLRELQENANRAWAALGHKMGFQPMTVRLCNGKGEKFFTAVPSETEEQRKERMDREVAEKKAAAIRSFLEKRRALEQLHLELKELEG